MIVDLDGVLVIAHSDKQDATATWKRTFGHHPITGFVDHGPRDAGEPVVGLLRAGKAGSNHRRRPHHRHSTGPGQPPNTYRRGRRTLIRTDSGCGTRDFLNWLTPRGRWLSNAVGMTITDTIHHAVLKIQASAWTPAVEPGCEIRDGAWVAELVGDCLTGWRAGGWGCA